jgi:hypothetical protein
MTAAIAPPKVQAAILGNVVPHHAYDRAQAVLLGSAHDNREGATRHCGEAAARGRVAAGPRHAPEQGENPSGLLHATPVIPTGLSGCQTGPPNGGEADEPPAPKVRSLSRPAFVSRCDWAQDFVRNVNESSTVFDARKWCMEALFAGRFR